VLAVASVAAWRRAAAPAPWVRVLLRMLVAWTVGVWCVRAVDIALIGPDGFELGGGHEPAFVAVHLVLAVVSMALGAWAVVADARTPTEEHTTPLTASHQNMA